VRKLLLSGVVAVVLASSAFAGPSSDALSKDSTKDASKGGAITASDVIKTNREYSAVMLNENTTNLNQKQLYLLQARQSKRISDDSFYIGARLVGLLDYQTSNVDNKFGWLMRHPTSTNQIGKEVSEAALHSVQMDMTGTVLPWLTIYGNLLYDPQQSFGGGTITDLNRNQIQLRKGYVLLGDLNKYPVYLTLGKFESPFGLTDTVDPFTSSTVWHGFGGLSYGVKAAYYKSGLNVSAELGQGGAQFRAMNTPVDGTDTPSRLNNPVLDANYTFSINHASNVLVGASYERGSAYCTEFENPSSHFASCNDANPAFDFYSKLEMARFTLQGEFAKTIDVWPATHNPDDFDQFAASKVTSFDIGAAYRLPYRGRDYTVSTSFSTFIAGPDGSPWHRQDQIVAGLSTVFKKTVKPFVEYIRVDGYVPLGGISNVDPATGDSNSDQGVHNNVFLVGIDVTI
jgi:hypothetical protein